jgi:general stress protein YciG
MSMTSIAKALGRRGGQARARTLTPERRREIASQGGRSKALSRHASRRIRENFEYLKRVHDLRKAASSHGS